MQALLRRQIWRPLHRFGVRYQHEYPHKEYFQNPGQTPHPDATPYAPPPAFPSSPSYFKRGLRSIAWATLFSTLGVAGGVGLLTWDYLQPPFEPGSEEDQEMLEEIEEMMDSHPLVQGLREGRWEEKIYKPAQTRFLQTLSGTLGLSMRGFRMDRTGYTILVFYTGSGLEGWPDVIHDIRNGDDLPQEHHLVVDFSESIRPGEIYSILVPPALQEGPFADGAMVAKVEVQCLLMRMDMAPEITIEVDEITRVRTDVVAIPSQSAENTIFARAVFHTEMAIPPEAAQADVGRMKRKLENKNKLAPDQLKMNKNSSQEEMRR